MSITGASESIDTDAEGEDADTTSPKAPNYDNPEQAEAIRQGLRDKQQERQEEFSQAERDKRAIQQAIAEKTCHTRMPGGKRIECTLLSGDEEEYIENTVGELAGVDEESLTDEQFQQYRESKERMVEMLVEHSVEDTYDYEFWKGLPSAVREGAVMDIREGGAEGNRR